MTRMAFFIAPNSSFSKGSSLHPSDPFTPGLGSPHTAMDSLMGWPRSSRPQCYNRSPSRRAPAMPWHWFKGYQVDLRIWSGIGGRVEEAQNLINQQDSREIQRMLWISFNCVLMMVLECWTSFLGLLFLVVGCSTWEDPLSKPAGLRKRKLRFTVILPGFNLSWRDGKIAWKGVSRL